MPPLTRRARRETTRKLAGALAALVMLAGCATSGPNHVYVATAGQPDIADLGPNPKQLSAVLAPGESAVGLAYDFNTDHLFVRVAPAQVIRVIERPSGKILREMPLPADLHTAAPADLAIRSSDRHLFALHPGGRAVVELSLFGEFIQEIALTGTDARSTGLAYDQKNQQLLVLTSENSPRIGTVGSNGHVTYNVTLPGGVSAVSLGYDSEARHFLVPLADGRGVGEFDATGKLGATHPVDGQPVTAIDAGPRSFVRVF